MSEVVHECAGSLLYYLSWLSLIAWLFVFGLSLISMCPEAFFKAHGLVAKKLFLELLPCFLRNHKKLAMVIFFVLVTASVVLAKF